MKVIITSSLLFFAFSGCFDGNISVENSPKTTQNNTSNPDASSTDASKDGESDCVSDNTYFSKVVNPVLTDRCGGCHAPVGAASQTGFVLQQANGFSDYLDRNQRAIELLVKNENRSANPDKKSIFLLKPLNLVDHEGGNVLDGDDEAIGVIQSHIDRIDNPSECEDLPDLPFLEGVTSMNGYQQLRRATLLLGGRLPSKSEIEQVDADPENLDAILENLFNEEGFYTFLETGWNDILHTRGLTTQNLDARSNPNRRYFEALRELEPVQGEGMSNADFKDLRDAHNVFFRREEVGSEYALRHAPVKLISYIVRNDRPFTEVLTADYMMVNPFSAKALDVYEKTIRDPGTGTNKIVKEMFTKTEAANEKSDFIRERLNYALDGRYPNDPNEYVPIQMNGGGQTGIPEGEDFYHSGLLSSILWRRIVSTETNVNRARSRVFFKIFLDTSILELAPRVGGADDAEDVENPVVNLSQCSVCHIPMDPVAACLQHFTLLGSRNRYNSRRGPWDQGYTAGFAGMELPSERLEDAERWLGEMASVDTRFPSAMVVNALFILTGKERINAPTDTNSFYYTQELRAYEAQRAEIKRISEIFVADNYNFKSILKEWLKSPLLTANNLTDVPDDSRAVELAGVGMSSLSTPENLDRKISAIFGEPWSIYWDYVRGDGSISRIPRTALVHERFIRQGGDDSELYFLYGGIDSRDTVTRLKIPNGIHGAVMNVLAEDLACQTAAKDFERPVQDRILFPYVALSDTLASGGEDAIRENLVYLFERILGERLQAQDEDIDAALALWSKIQKNGEANGGVKLNDCGIGNDDLYTKRAWQSLLTYLLSDFKFLYD